MRCAVAVLALALLTGGTAVTQASAQEGGVYLDDPDSPGGKEYSIPHERTRRGTSGDGSPGSGSEATRFGVGIEAQGGTASAGGKNGTSEVAGDSDSGGEESGGSGAGGDGFGGTGSGGAAAGEGSGRDSGSASGQAPYHATSASDPDPDLTVYLIALGVLLAGGALGLLLRRLRRDPLS